MKTLPLFCFAVLLAGPLCGKDKVTFDDLLLEDGTVLKQVTVLKVEPDGLRLEHEAGVNKVKFEDLPEVVQKQFAFDRTQALKFREEKEAVREARASEERQARVEEVLQERKEEQDADLQRAREAFFKLLESDEYTYPQLDKSLMDSIAIFKEAGRKDLAALLEDDRRLLREREIVRPGDRYRAEREQLLDRIRLLENELAQINNGAAGPAPVFTETEVVPFFIDRPVVIDRTITVDPHEPCPPGGIRPPAITRPPWRPVSSPPVVTPLRPAQPVQPVQQSPQFRPVAPSTSPMPVRPSAPSTQVVMPSSGAQQQGSHLWKK